MYERHFNFTCKPFALNPDPGFLYRSRQHAAALTMFEFALESQVHFGVLTGDIGSGKTTLVRQLIRMLGKDIAVGLISNTHERLVSIVPWALSALSVQVHKDNEIGQYEAFTDFVVRRYAQGGRTLLIVDEAQNLSLQGLEDLRLLSNVNSEKDVALQIVLVGQPELRAKLDRPELVQFAQRVGVDYHLDCLALNDTLAYIQHRLTVAGGDRELFRTDAIALVHHRTHGVPRLINQLCDLCLVYAYAEQLSVIEASLVRQVLQERDRGRKRAPSLDGPGPSLLAKPVELGAATQRP